MKDVLQDGKFWGWVVGVVMSTIMALSWMDAHFITRADADLLVPENHVKVHDGIAESIDALTAEVQKTNEGMRLHMEKERLERVKQAISANDSETFAVEQFIRLNGEDSQSEERLRKLNNERAELDLKKTCIISGNRICD